MYTMKPNFDYDEDFNTRRELFSERYRARYAKIRLTNIDASSSELFKLTKNSLKADQQLLFDQEPFDAAHRNAFLMTLWVKFIEDHDRHTSRWMFYFLKETLPPLLTEWDRNVGLNRDVLAHANLLEWSAGDFVQHLAQQIAYDEVISDLHDELIPTKGKEKSDLEPYSIPDSVALLITLIESSHPKGTLGQIDQTALATMIARLTGNTLESVRQIVVKACNEKMTAVSERLNDVSADVMKLNLVGPDCGFIEACYMRAKHAK